MKEYEETSLSVGIAIFHYHEMLDQALDFARQAEKIAKKTGDGNRDSYRDDDPIFGDRNGLAVSFYSRGNVPITVRERWNDGENSLFDRLKYWGKKFQEGKQYQQENEKTRREKTDRQEETGLPGGFPYDLYKLIVSQVYCTKEWLQKSRPQDRREVQPDYGCLKEALYRDVMRIIRQKSSIPENTELYRKIEKRVANVATEYDLERFVSELLVAKEIGEYAALRKKQREDDNV